MIEGLMDEIDKFEGLAEIPTLSNTAVDATSTIVDIIVGRRLWSGSSTSFSIALSRCPVIGFIEVGRRLVRTNFCFSASDNCGKCWFKYAQIKSIRSGSGTFKAKFSWKLRRGRVCCIDLGDKATDIFFPFPEDLGTR